MTKSRCIYGLINARILVPHVFPYFNDTETIFSNIVDTAIIKNMNFYRSW